MTKKTIRNHFSPTLANTHWAQDHPDSRYSYYHFCTNRKFFVKSKNGLSKKSWGFQENLYPQVVEDEFANKIENDAKFVYEKMLGDLNLSHSERVSWARFILTQAMRTPSYIKYRELATKITGRSFEISDILDTDSYGRLEHILRRSWIVLKAAEDDFFIRTDNPVYMTGFIELPDTVLIYPLSPKMCFVACSIPKGQEHNENMLQKRLQLEKGDSFRINFELAMSASRSLILSGDDDCQAFELLCKKVMGKYPQIPFLMGLPGSEMQSIRVADMIVNLMRQADEVNYGYKEYPFTPFYGYEFEFGLNPFSIFGLTDSAAQKVLANIEKS